MIDRRGFARVTLAGLLGVPLALRAQTATKRRRVGFLWPGLLSEAQFQEFWAEPLRKLGWVEGRNIVFEKGFTDDEDKLSEVAEELVRLKVDVIVAPGSTVALAAKKATTTIPIVMTADDPVGLGVVASLSRPGGNVTGYAFLGADVIVKNAGLVHELIPAAKRATVLWSFPKAGDAAEITVMLERLRARMESAYRSLGMEVDFIDIDAPGFRIEDVPAEAARRGAQVLEIDAWPDGTLMKPTLQKAIEYRLATIVQNRNQVKAGGLMSFTINYEDSQQRFIAIIDKVLRGAKPAETPVEQPTRFEIAVNVKTAKAIGITVPQSILLRADEVIR
jgi:putative ABC transport system substrate-binding protein